ncbi:hypothetical protein H4219_003968 [Mycoemilia scoparia]|uniref:Uncharacterized protein n=1 Tax=Mycoemilia scoparia TaxID=417184 RepID=A0A9W8DSL2_9FUNG|nr:hypothetical protein H4219_003968 [Mycoemilia scoparia]
MTKRKKKGGTNDAAQNNSSAPSMEDPAINALEASSVAATSRLSKSGSNNAIPLGRVELIPSRHQTFDVGVLHLYKGSEIPTESPENEPTPDIISPSFPATILAVLAIPGYMTPLDFVAFTGAYQDKISHFRVIRDTSPNRYMIVLQMVDKESASEFHRFYNGKTFSPLEPETCHVVYIQSVKCRATSTPWYKLTEQIEHESSSSALIENAPTSSNSATTSNTTAPHKTVLPEEMFIQQPTTDDPDLNGANELPTCPVCLERLDQTASGLLTIFCQHTFHCRCLAMWGDGNCPVCRYTQATPFVDQDRFQATIESLNDRLSLTSLEEPNNKSNGGSSSSNRNNQSRSSDPYQTASETTNGAAASTSTRSSRQQNHQQAQQSENQCSVCKAKESLWICLICGSVGCGRYNSAHAHSHFKKTQHPYSMDLETQRVWDYVGDGYVHRILQNKSDGKLVELPPPTMAANNSTNSSQGQSLLASNSTSLQNGSEGKSRNRQDSYSSSSLDPNSSQLHNGLSFQSPNDDSIIREKIEAMSEEYEILLTSQLESQRIHYEAKLEGQIKANHAQQSDNQILQDQILQHKQQIAQQAKEYQLQKQVNNDQKSQIKELKVMVKKLGSELDEEKEINKQLRQNLTDVKAMVEEYNNKIIDLKDQLNDFMGYFEAKEKMEKDEHLRKEIDEGTMMVSSTANTKKKQQVQRTEPTSPKAGGSKKKTKKNTRGGKGKPISDILSKSNGDSKAPTSPP